MWSIHDREFADRRQKTMEAMGEDSVAILTSPPARTRSKDTEYPYRPSSDILYLTGFEEPETTVVLAPGHPEGEFVMFVRGRDAEKEVWNGPREGPEGATEHCHADAAFSNDELEEKLPEWLENRETLYYTLGQDAEFDQKVAGWLNKLRYRRDKAPAAPRRVVDFRDIVHEQRLFKRPEEIRLMRTAAEITAQAHVHAMERCRPGVFEYQLEATIEHHFRTHGANFPAYTSIVGTGANATVLHYVKNRDELEPGHVVLIDAGCEYEYYAADITRTFPVSGSFTSIQRDAYQAVLDVEVAAIEDVAPGTRYIELQDNAVRRLTRALVDLGVLDGAVDDLIEEEEYKRYYPHKIGHWLGIDVHDVGSYHDEDGDWRVLEPGMVLTIEPGLYFPEDDDAVPPELRGVGIRIEDDVLVTQNGRENLTAACPKAIDEIEAIVGSG